MIGELIGEWKGKGTFRVLAEGKMEVTNVGSGSILGKETTVMETVVMTRMPNGVTMVEGNGMIMTAEGENVTAKLSGIGWSTGKGLKCSFRGAHYFMTSSSKLASLNKTVGVYEFEQDEKGEYSDKIWAWK